MGQGDSGQRSKPAGLLRDRGGPREVPILCDMHSFMPVRFFRFLSMNDFFTRMFVCCCCN